MVKAKCAELRTKDRKELLRTLNMLKVELHDLRVASVSGGAQSKLSRIPLVRKAIARVYIVMHQKQKENLRKVFRSERFKPLDLRRRRTRSKRKALPEHHAKLKTLKELRKRSKYPPRKYAIRSARCSYRAKPYVM